MRPTIAATLLIMHSNCSTFISSPQKRQNEYWKMKPWPWSPSSIQPIARFKLPGLSLSCGPEVIGTCFSAALVVSPVMDHSKVLLSNPLLFFIFFFSNCDCPRTISRGVHLGWKNQFGPRLCLINRVRAQRPQIAPIHVASSDFPWRSMIPEQSYDIWHAGGIYGVHEHGTLELKN